MGDHTHEVEMPPSSASPTSSMMSTILTSSSTTPSISPTQSANGSGGSPASGSPLLFFVALGFGVVFTNLWIIVGVKYCFRYNQRNRQPRTGENGEIDMTAMPRPHRRRREKKLMTMDEVNERFPLTKYKAWVTGREKEGLPAVGGVTAPASRPASLRGADGTMRASTELNRTDGEGTKAPFKDVTLTSSTAEEAENEASTTHDKRFSESSALETSTEDQKNAASTTDLKPSTTTTTTGEEEDEDDDHIHTAVPPELLTNPGDSCAICLDTLEDDDDVRGLTCGHAFHAGCLDPWLTNRRACCPLCKADYYVPKPRAEGEESEERGRRTAGSRPNMPAAPQGAWVGSRGNPAFRTRMVLPGRFMAVTPGHPSAHDRYGFPVVNRERRNRRAQNTGNTDVSYTADQQESASTRPAGSRFNFFRRGAAASTEPQAPSPPGEVSYSATPATTDAAASEVQPEPQRSRFPRIHFPGRLRRTGDENQVVGAAEPTPGELESGR